MNAQPSLLTFTNGEPVATAAQWPARRRELVDILSREVYGISPPPAPVSGQILSTDTACCSGHAVQERVALTATTPTGPFTFPLQVVCPTKPGPHPLILFINFRPALYDQYCPVEELIDNGFALAQVYYGDLTADNDDFRDGLAACYPRDTYTWGKIAMWAWGLSRALDYLLTRPEFEKDGVAVAGHSRLGKTALWCAAQDERVAFTLANCSGCAGAAYERAKAPGAETVAHITKAFPYWFAPAYAKWAGRVAEMPFDQHFLLAAIAPRRVCVGSASEDRWADPPAEQFACRAASPAFSLCGGRPFEGGEWPAATGDAFLGGDIGYFLRDGIHFFGRSDWQQYMTFIQAHR